LTFIFIINIIGERVSKKIKNHNGGAQNMFNQKKSFSTKLMLLLTVALMFICITLVFAGPKKVRYVSGNDVNLRSEPSTDAKVTTILKQSDRLYVETYKSGWLKVVLEDGTKGWVHENYIAGQKAVAPKQMSSRGYNTSLKIRYINADNVNLRETPSLAGHVMTSLSEGKKVYAQSYNSSGWVSLYLDNGTKGWVHEKFLSASLPDKSSTKEEVKVRYIIGNNVNIRNNPSQSAAITRTVAKGEKVFVKTYDTRGWVQVVFSDKTSGWVHEKFVGSSASETPGMKVRYIVGSHINLRNEPSLNSSVIGSAKNGEKIFVETYDEAGWAYVAFTDGTKAWVSDDYISDTPLPDGMKIRYVCGNGVNVRDKPTLSSSVITVANQGDKTFVETYDTSGWAKVVMDGERIGWINEKYLTNSPNEENSVTASKIRYIQGNGVYLRKNPSLDAGVITTLNNALEVYVESYDENGWVFVATESGTKGWVYKGYVGVDILPEQIATYTPDSYSTDSYSYSYSDSYSSDYESYGGYYESAPSAQAYSAPPPSSGGNGLVDTAYSYMGVPYVWGGTTPYGFDCSGFAQTVYAENGLPITRTADAQFAEGTPVDTQDLQPGDLVFFETYTYGASHVGVYIGNSEFIHASSGAGEVTISDLESEYYNDRYLGARRY